METELLYPEVPVTEREQRIINIFINTCQGLISKGFSTDELVKSLSLSAGSLICQMNEQTIE